MSPVHPLSAEAQETKHENGSPRHVAIIMDGNGRWAKVRNLPRTAGHQRGARAVKTAVKSAVSAGVSYLTLYGFSSENWNRPDNEIKDLMGLLRFYLKNEVSTLHKEGVRLLVIGDRSRLDDDIVGLIEESEAKTSINTRLTLVLALSYGGRAEIAQAARVLAEKALDGTIDPASIDENSFAKHLYTADIPDPDILIRTSGEKRISNFLLWQLAYAEFVFLDCLWPDFSKQDFDAALGEYNRRERRYGKTSG